MSWAVGYDSDWHRDVGYGVPAVCDHPGCNEEIHRGLAYRCGHINGDHGCGLHFCGKHLYFVHNKDGLMCERCRNNKEPFEPKPDVQEWMRHKLKHKSWRPWRAENPNEVAAIKEALKRSTEGITNV